MYKHPKIQYSIHPRNWPSGNRAKKNTCHPMMQGKYLRKARHRLAIRRLDYAALMKSLSSAQPETAFRCPGSMWWR